MKLLLIGIIVFLVILYIYTYVRYKKMKKNRISAVEDFKNKYHKKEQKEQKELDQIRNNDPMTTYTSKFNSSLDYVEKNQLAEETQEMKKLKIVPKRLQF